MKYTSFPLVYLEPLRYSLGVTRKRKSRKDKNTIKAVFITIY